MAASIVALGVQCHWLLRLTKLLTLSQMLSTLNIRFWPSNEELM